jgi:hypothetical protein
LPLTGRPQRAYTHELLNRYQWELRYPPVKPEQPEESETRQSPAELLFAVLGHGAPLVLKVCVMSTVRYEAGLARALLHGPALLE